MFTQLFGHYLLNKGIITGEQLRAALEAKNGTRAKLGALAIDAGYMTAEQVEQVHEEQRRVDKRIGDIAVGMGFLTSEQVDELLARQKTANIVLGQTLIDLGYLTNKQFEEALSGYKASASFADENTDDSKLASDFIAVLGLENSDKKDIYVEYLLLLVKNLIRFVGDDFVIGKRIVLDSVKHSYAVSQEIKGEIAAYTAICGEEKAFIGIASRYAGEEVTAPDEFAEACVGEFLNLQNGLFSVNISNEKNIELDLTPQTPEHGAEISIAGGVAIELNFSFGNIIVVVRGK